MLSVLSRFGDGPVRAIDVAWAVTVGRERDADGVTNAAGFDSDGNGVFDGFDTDGQLDIDRSLDTTDILGTTWVGGAGETVDTLVTWSAFGEMTTHTTTIDPLGWTFGRIYTHDVLGRIASVLEVQSAAPTSVTDYGYDDDGRLAWADEVGGPRREYVYDVNGNRIQQVDKDSAGVVERTLYGRFDEQDRLLSWGEVEDPAQPGVADAADPANWHFAYNLLGQLVGKDAPVASGKPDLVLTYDVLGNLLAVDLDDDHDGTADRWVTYDVDHRGRRVGRTYDDGVNGPVEHFLLYGDQLNPIAMLEEDQAGNRVIVAALAYGTDGHSPDLMWTPTGTMRFVKDQLGSVRFVLAPDGSRVQELTYDEWGQVAWDPNATVEQPFGYAGGLHDPVTGLVRFGARDYDPMVGRWTAKDPIGFEGGDTLLYGYVGGEPNGRVDPTGKVAIAPMLPWLGPLAEAAAGVLAGAALGLAAWLGIETLDEALDDADDDVTTDDACPPRDDRCLDRYVKCQGAHAPPAWEDPWDGICDQCFSHCRANGFWPGRVWRAAPVQGWFRCP